MLKSQDLLVVLKILSYEDFQPSHLKLTYQLQGQAWLHPNDPTEKYVEVYSGPEVYSAEAIEREPDFDEEELRMIDMFLMKPQESDMTNWTYRKLAAQLFMSVSETNNAVKRAIGAGLLTQMGTRLIKVNRPKLVEFIRYGSGISFFVKRGGIVRGIPTANAAPVFEDIFASSVETPPVWPCARGTVKGVAIEPLYKSVTKAVMVDGHLYKMLAAVDIFRTGTAREKEQTLPFLKFN
ncbi:hypothetical protein [Aliagarivorans taiwanensis]|uniref:hypothetical protein n=1 Tax=Aliagarivorans taiwanensis TaxID=561966 RepID=UPI00047C94D4|nr:hypothetical protein [Aliagarivorans taiwanensis]